MKPTAVVLIAGLVVLALPMAIPAQERNGAAEMSITGCFHKGNVEGQYVLTDDKTNKKITVTGDASMLRGHTHNHRVTITGLMTKDKDRDVLKATKLQMVWTRTLGCKLGSWNS